MDDSSRRGPARGRLFCQSYLAMEFRVATALDTPRLALSWESRRSTVPPTHPLYQTNSASSRDDRRFRTSAGLRTPSSPTGSQPSDASRQCERPQGAWLSPTRSGIPNSALQEEPIRSAARRLGGPLEAFFRSRPSMPSRCTPAPICATLVPQTT